MYLSVQTVEKGAARCVPLSLRIHHPFVSSTYIVDKRRETNSIPTQPLIDEKWYMTSHGKLTLRPLPHLDFVLGWPGIAGSANGGRNPAHLAGNVEVRMGSKGSKAKWLRIELRKIETVPGGESWGELIGTGPIE